ncbi:MAG: hypothetical protein ACRBHB_22080 [Arenicella sp.]
MIQSKTSRLWLQSAVVFVAFMSYFATTAFYLPNGAGPDYPLSRVAADFYLENGRLATIPEDEAKMGFSMFGNSRLLRPPLGYASAAVVAKLRGTTLDENKERYYSYRLANAFYGALAVAAAFAALYIFFNSLFVALFGALLIGLLPQFTFTASYLNDDGSAIAAVSLTAMSIALIFRQGATLGNCLFFAFSVGLTIITKKAGWVFLPAAFLFYLGYILRFDKDFWVKHAAMAVVFVLAGGWWLIFNMLQYGWDDPILSKVINETAWRNTDVDLNRFGFVAEFGIGMRALLLENHGNFIGATYMAVVGHLDWLVIRVGRLQYVYYYIVVFGLIANVGFLFAEAVSSRLRSRRVWFEVILYIAIGLQVMAYVWTNLYNDVQIQGKYILPAFLPMLILSLSFYVKLFATKPVSAIWSNEQMGKVKFIMMGLVLLSPIVVHLDALLSHVIPHYWPQSTTAVMWQGLF